MAGLKEFEEAVDAFSDPKGFRDFWTFQGRNLIQEIVGNASPERDSSGSELRFLEVFVTDKSCRIELGSGREILTLVSGEANMGTEL